MLLLCAYCAPAPETKIAAAVDKPDPAKRGEYLVEIMGCNDCHSPKIMTDQGMVPDPARLLSGYPSSAPIGKVPDKKAVETGQWVMFNGDLTAGAGPWGITFSANLTPDESGLGSWSFDQFKKALTQGKFKGLDNGRSLLPPMPWPNYRNLKDEDIQAIFAYLKTLPPVKNVVPAPIPPTEL